MEGDAHRLGGAAENDAATPVAWRTRVAQQVADAYGEAPHVAALAIAGSVGAGWADRWSDLELDCYWLQPPTVEDRLLPMDRTGGALVALWDYDEDHSEWSEDYRIGSLGVTVSNFTVDTIDGFVHEVVDAAGTGLVQHLRLAAIERCRPLRGGEVISAWREQARRYPDELVAAMVEDALHPDVLSVWSSRPALVERGDHIALHSLLSGVERAVLSALLALNRIYRPHPISKWQRHLIDELRLVPDHFEGRLASLWGVDLHEATSAADSLMADTLALAGRHSSARLDGFREALAGSREPVEPP